MFYKEDVDSCSKSKLADEQLAKLKKLIIIYQENPYHIQEFLKYAYNKSIKPKSYISNNKIWLNNKYIKINWNWKLKTKFFRPFWVLCPVNKQAYKLKLPKK